MNIKQWQFYLYLGLSLVAGLLIGEWIDQGHAQHERRGLLRDGLVWNVSDQYVDPLPGLADVPMDAVLTREKLRGGGPCRFFFDRLTSFAKSQQLIQMSVDVRDVPKLARLVMLMKRDRHARAHIRFKKRDDVPRMPICLEAAFDVASY